MTPSDFLVFSDGSGHIDGYGGWASYMKSVDGRFSMYRAGSMIGTSVDRMEMTAMLEGLQMVLEIIPHADQSPRLMKTWKPKVDLFSDRENMVLSIRGTYSRSNSADLWRRFEFYESLMVIEAFHVPRETDYPEFVQVDLDASSGRILIKDFAEKCKLMAQDYKALSDHLPSHLPPKP